MVGAAAAIGSAVQGVDDHANGLALRAEELIIGIDHAIGIVHEVLRVLQSRIAERGIDIYRHASARAGSYKLRVSLVRGPLRCGGSIPAHGLRLSGNGSCFDAVVHLEPPFGQIDGEETRWGVTAFFLFGPGSMQDCTAGHQ